MDKECMDKETMDKEGHQTLLNIYKSKCITAAFDAFHLQRKLPWIANVSQINIK